MAREDTSAATTRAAASSRHCAKWIAVLSGLSLVEEVKGSLAEVNREVRAKAATIGPNALIGSTVAVLLIWDDQSCCLWAGDSRLYRMRAGQLRQLSRDQSHVQDLVDRGEILPEAAAAHPMANIVTNLIGAFDRLVLEERRDRLEPGDILLLCSDGLSSALSGRRNGRHIDRVPGRSDSRPTDRASARSGRAG